MANNKECAVDVTLRVIGGRWKSVILYHLHDKTVRFGELQRLIPGITQKMLAQQLKELEHHGVVSRKVYAQVPPRVDYSLTKFGMTLCPILRAMAKWGSDHREKIGAKRSWELRSDNDPARSRKIMEVKFPIVSNN